MEDLKQRFQTSFPGKFFLNDSKREVENYLRSRKFLKDHESVQVIEKPGEGNMNLVRRVVTNRRSFILKQARPWAEKYPSIDAPVERNEVESRYFQAIHSDKFLLNLSPEVIFTDQDNFILMLDDLGEGADYAFIYQPDKYLTGDEMKSLVSYLMELHELNISDFPDNRSMRILNHEYIFRLPFLETNGLNLNAIQTGLHALSLSVKRNDQLKSRIALYGDLYLDSGPVLIHGDYFPGSWLRTQSGLKIIDPEFSFLGYAEFDLGVFAAHMVLAQQGKERIELVLREYKASSEVSDELIAGFCGIEILRRLFGVAQLPLSIDITGKKELTEIASGWILTGKLEFDHIFPVSKKL